jgi:hypothetical protein
MTLLAGRDPIGVVFYRDDESREDLLDLCEMLAPTDRQLVFADAVDDAFRRENNDVVLLITPIDEAEAVRTLEGRREELLDREAPAILFLMQDGSAERVLNRDAPALSSFLRGLTYDPEPPVNEREIDERRARFTEAHGRTPDEWLQAWEHDEIEDTANNNLTAQEAWPLRTPRAPGAT